MTPLILAVAAGAWGASGMRAFLDGQWRIGSVFMGVAFFLACSAAYCQHLLMRRR